MTKYDRDQDGCDGEFPDWCFTKVSLGVYFPFKIGGPGLLFDTVSPVCRAVYGIEKVFKTFYQTEQIVNQWR